MFKRNTTTSPTNRSIKAIVAITALGVIASLTSAPAAADSDALAKTRPAAVASKETAPVAPTDWLALKAAAVKDGTVPVVATFKTNSAPSMSDARAEHHRRQHSELKKKFKKVPKALKTLDGAPFVALHANPEELMVLKSAPELDSVIQDGVVFGAGTTSYGSANGQQLGSQWDFRSIRADWANANGYSGRGQAIAVVDTGVDRYNPYLNGKVTVEACFASYNDGSGACPNGQYYQYSTAATGLAGSAAPCTYALGCSHGTHVAHTAAGAYGVARGATIVAIQASHKQWNVKANSYQPSFNYSDIMNSLWYVRTVLPKAGVTIAAVNMSLTDSGQNTNYCDSAVQGITNEIINLKRDLAIPTVIASGNNNYANAVSWPGCISAAITVGNTTMTAASGGVDAVLGYVAGGSNTSTMLDLLAPGTDICSAVPVALDMDGSAKDGWQCGWYGTSMAAPQVTGALAILTQKKPTATVDQLQTALARAGTYGGLAIQDSRNTNVTRTRINVANAVYYNI